MTSLNWRAIVVTLCVILFVTAVTPSQACYACTDPIILSRDPWYIPPSSGEVVRLTIYGKNIDTVGPQSRWQKYWHIWIRKTSLEGAEGPWTLCAPSTGCTYVDSRSNWLKLDINGSDWAAEDGGAFQLHYFLGLTSEDLSDPSLNKTNQKVTGWSNVATWQVGYFAADRGVVTPPPPPTKVEPPIGIEPEVVPGPDKSAGAVRSDACARGYVWREANADDHVCVLPQARDRTRVENASAGSRTHVTDGGGGPPKCLDGYVWREAFAGDFVCVSPDVRDIVRRENAEGPSHRAKP